MEMEADFFTWVVLLVTNKKRAGSYEKDGPDCITCYTAPHGLLQTEDPDCLDDLQVAIQTDQAKKGDAGVHVDVKEHTHDFAQEEGSLFVVEVNPQGQTQEQEEVG